MAASLLGQPRSGKWWSSFDRCSWANAANRPPKVLEFCRLSMNGCLGKIINLIYCAVHMYTRQKGFEETLLQYQDSCQSFTRATWSIILIDMCIVDGLFHKQFNISSQQWVRLLDLSLLEYLILCDGELVLHVVYRTEGYCVNNVHWTRWH